MPISKERLIQLAESEKTVARGIDYAVSGRVLLQETTQGLVLARVDGSNHTVHIVSFLLNSDEDDVKKASCNCPAFREYSGVCKHVIAAIWVYQSQHKPAYIPKPTSDLLALRLMNRVAQELADSALENGKAMMVATLHCDQDVRLSFKLGETRLYILQDVTLFHHRMVQSADFAYGKTCMLRHRIASFDTSSQDMVEFFMEHYDNNNYLYGKHFYPTPKKYLFLAPHMIDDFMARFTDKGIACELGETEQLLTLTTEDYKPSLTLKKNGDHYVLTLLDKMQLVRGQKRSYVITFDGKLHSCSAAWRKHCEPLLQTLQANKQRLRFVEGDLPSLFTTVLAQAKPFLYLTVTNVAAQFVPPPLVTRVYLDTPQPGCVAGRMTFHYGDKSHTAMTPKQVSESYDIAGELRAEQIFADYFRTAPDSTGQCIIENDDDLLYNLMAQGISRLAAVAEVYTSEDFKEIRIQPPTAVSVGVRVASNLLQLDFEVEGLDLTELAGVLEAYRRAKRYYLLRNGSFLTLEEGALNGLSALADGLDLNAKQLASGHVTLPLHRALYVDNMLKKAEDIIFDRDTAFKSMIRDMQDVADSDFAVPSALRKTLRSYQKTGYRWLRTIDYYKFGGILADDMGLGKTLQVLALLSNYAEGGSKKPSIVVCPASLLLNWESEANKFTPHLSIKALTGSAAERAATLQQLDTLDLLITSYHQVSRDIAHYENIQFAYIIVDEAQFIKNHNTQSAKSVKLLQGQTKFALTGTPIENNLAELWSIFDFIMPGYLWNYHHFRVKYETLIVKQSDKITLEKLKQLVRPFMLRRLKQDVLSELPPKTETILHVEMEEAQRKVYLATLAQVKQDLLQTDEKLLILAALTRLRQICCDPALLFENYTGGSTKLDACMELIENCLESNHRILVFSQFTSMLDRMETRLTGLGLTWYRIDGTVSPTDRMQLVNDFNAGAVPIFLISLKAGGTGLNLTGADVVIHYDPWWNLSAQNQATDRAHRIGQKNAVQVFKLIVKGTLEERILRLQADKANLADQIVLAESGGLASMSRDEILTLLEVQ